MSSPTSARPDRRVLRVARILTATYAVATVVALVVWAESPVAHHTGRVVALLDTLNLPVGHTLVSVAVTALVTRALVGRKRVGWWAVVAFQVLGAYLSAVDLLTPDPTPAWAPWRSSSALGNALDVVSIVLAPLLLWALWKVRPVFSGRLQTGSWPGALGLLAGGGVLTSVVAWLLLLAVETGEPEPMRERWWALISISLGDKDGGAAGELYGLAPWVPEVCEVLIALSIVASVVLLLRSARHDTDWSGEREVALRRLLAEHGDDDSLGYFATRRDKSSIFSRDGRAAVTYAVINGVSLASGDPIGRRESWADAVERWQAQAREFGWTPAVLSASEAGARVYAEHGLRVLPLGDEAILDPDRFELRRTSMTPVRHAVQRATRAGVTVTVRRQDALEQDELDEVWECAEKWRGDEPDRGFSMALNREQDPADARVLVVTARAADGELLGVLSLVPWGRRKVSLDVMRRSPAAPNGLVELMVATLMAQAGTLGVRMVSLNFCMFRRVYADAERVGSGPMTRIGYSVLGTLDRFWQLERLYVSNEKFEPEWFPRFVCLEDPVSLPQVAIAAGMAEGFLPRPRLVDPVRPRRLGDEELAEVVAIETAPVEPLGARPRRTDQTRHRLENLVALTASGREGYPVAPPAEERPDHRIDALDEDTWERGQALSVSGRVRALRDHGGVVFATLVDGSASVQLLVEGDDAGDFARLVDLGDLLLVRAVPGRSRRGTRSLLVESWTMLAKALHPIPFDRFADPETRVRQRSTDLLVNAEGAAALRARSRVLGALRRTLDEGGFCEVETPILQTVHGGATARPFRTRINVYGMDLYLRIAPELYLKRLVVGGLGAVYEIGRNFRNEGVDATHNPEFTSLEAYLPYADYDDMRRLTERLVRAAAVAVHGAPVLPLDGELVDVSAPWPVVPVLDAVSAAVGQEVSLETDLDVLVGLARRHGVQLKGDVGPGAVIEELYGELVEPATVLPTFYTDFPAETSPLTRPHRSQPGLVERWDLVVAGTELGTAYSELTDPAEQRRRLVAQSLRAAAGDVEAMEVDEDFLRALELGMPPTGGLGIGVDRLAMLLLGTPIRGVLSFPFAKPLR